MIYLVSADGVPQQAFALMEDALTFASEHPNSRLSRHPLRQSIDEAVVVYDRRVVVANGDTLSDQTSVVRQFVDHTIDTPGPADVEWFHDTADSSWHIAGFGTDKAELDVQVRRAIDHVGQLADASTLSAVGEPAPL